MKQTRKSKTNRKKTNRKKTTRTKSRTRRNKRMMKGGKSEISLGITYDTIFEYLLELLNRPDFKQIYEKNIEFIKSISINNDNFSVAFDFSTNKQFRNFINDLLQWLLFDYNPYIFNTLLTVIYSCFNDDEFLKDNVDSLDDNVDSLDDNDGSLQILFKKLQDMILYKIGQSTNDVEKTGNDVEKTGNDVEKTNEINLLILILYVLTIPSVTTAVSNFINNNKVVFQNNLSDIICVINNIKNIDIKNNIMVRKLITNYFESLKIDSANINVTEVLKLLGKFGDCIHRLLLHLTGNYVASKGKSIGESVSQSIGKHIISPAQSLYSRIPKFQIQNILPK
jgi:hypothetical protein